MLRPRDSTPTIMAELVELGDGLEEDNLDKYGSLSTDHLAESFVTLTLEDPPGNTSFAGGISLKQSLLEKYFGIEPDPESDEDFDYVVEVYGFCPNLKTKDILNELSLKSSSRLMRLKWVNDTHALAIYASSGDASFVAESSFKIIKTRLLSESPHEESLLMAKSVAKSIRESLCAKMSSKRSQDSKKVHAMPSGLGQEPSLDSETDPPPPTEKPPLSASVARRMIGHALGVRINASPEQREKESKLLKEAKEKKRQRRAC